MERYWLFGGDFGYAGGGIADLRDTYASLPAAEAAAIAEHRYSDGSGFYTLGWFQVVDMERSEVIKVSHGPLGAPEGPLDVGPIKSQGWE